MFLEPKRGGVGWKPLPDFIKGALKVLFSCKFRDCYILHKKKAVVRRCYVKKVFLKISKETLGEVFSCEFCEIFKNTFFYRTPLVAASEKAQSMITKVLEIKSKN